MPYLKVIRDGSLHIAVHLQPKASRSAVLGIHDDCLKIAVSAPPVDGKANMAIMELLAELVHVPRRNVTIEHGHLSRKKVCRIEGVSEEEFRGIIRSVCTQ